MFKRVMVAVVCLPILILVLYAAPVFVLPMAVALLSGIAAYEALWSTGFLKHSRISLYSVVLAVLIPFWVFCGAEPVPAVCGLFLYAVAMFADAMGSRKAVGLEEMGGAFFLSAIIPFFLSSFVRLRQLAQWRFYIFLPFVVAFTSDAFALFAGMAFGKHKLAPELSPHKTVEGAVGGLAGAVVCSLVYGLLAGPLFDVQGVRLWTLVVYGAVGSVSSQFGDLAFSYIKREYGLKDFGNLFPGHGGVLDRFDSVTFCAPFVELMIHFLPVIV